MCPLHGGIRLPGNKPSLDIRFCHLVAVLRAGKARALGRHAMGSRQQLKVAPSRQVGRNSQARKRRAAAAGSRKRRQWLVRGVSSSTCPTPDRAGDKSSQDKSTIKS